MESNTAVEGGRRDGDGDEWRRLEAAVRSLLDANEILRRRATAADERIRELEDALSAVSTGRLDPVELSDQLRLYEHENRLLNARLDQAREVVDRIQSRLQFLEIDS